MTSLGLASVPTDTRVFFEINGKRVSGKAAFSSDRVAVVSFAPALVVKAGSTETLDLFVELDTDSGNDFQFSGKVTSSSADSNLGSFTTSTLRTATYKVVTTEFAKAGSDNTYNQSADAVELGRFTVENVKPVGVTETRDVTLNNITLRQLGTGDLEDLANLHIERNGVKVSSETIVSSKDVTFILNDTIKDASTATYYVRAEIISVENNGGDTYKFSLRNTSDLSATEDLNGFRSTVSIDETTTEPYNTLNEYKVNGADVVFSRDSSVELSKNYAKGTNNVVLMKGTITSKTAMTLEDITLDYTVSGETANTKANTLFDTVYLKIGSSVMTWSADASGAAEFLGLATVNGTANVEIYAKLKDDAPAKTFKFADLRLSSFDKAEYVANQNTVSASVGSISAVSVSVDSTAVSITRVDGLGDTNLAVGSKNVTLYGVNLKVTQGNPVSISNAEFTVTNTDTDPAVAEVTDLVITAEPTADGNITVAGDTVAVLDADTIEQVVDKVVAWLAANVTYNVVKKNATTVTLTAKVAWVLADLTYVAAQGVTATVTVTTQGSDITATNEHLNNVFATLYINGEAVKTETIKAGTVKFSGITREVTSAGLDMTVKADLSDAFENGDISLKLTALDMVDTLTSKTVDLVNAPQGAEFTIATAKGTVASSDNNPKRSVLLSGAKDQKLLAFKVKAENDTIKLRDLVFTATSGLSKLSNFRVTDSSNNLVATATTTADDELTFENITTDNSIAMDVTKSYYLVADVNTNVSGVEIKNLVLDQSESNIRATNGSTISMVGSDVEAKQHLIEENTLFVAKKVNNNKALSNAMVISITAEGKDSITIDWFTAVTSQAVWYDNAGAVKMYRDNVEVSALNNNNTIDAGSTVEFVLKVEGYAVNAWFTGTRSLQVELSDIDTSNINSIKIYDNTGLTTSFIETIN